MLREQAATREPSLWKASGGRSPKPATPPAPLKVFSSLLHQIADRSIQGDSLACKHAREGDDLFPGQIVCGQRKGTGIVLPIRAQIDLLHNARRSNRASDPVVSDIRKLVGKPG